MKIVYCHNYYRHRGGEDISFENDIEMLREEGHEVIKFVRDNRELTNNQLLSAAQTFWNWETNKELVKLLGATKPDILHCNNLFPQISSSAYFAAKKLKIPVVQALRNYRAFCANSFLYRDGKVCTSCLSKKAAWKGIVHGCYRDSRAASSVLAAVQLFHRFIRVNQRYVDAFFTPTNFSRKIYLEGGFPHEKLFVRSNFLMPDKGLRKTHEGHAVFVGRLSPEKGVNTLVDTWITHGIPMDLHIIGEGPQEDWLRDKARVSPRIKFLGSMSKEQVLEHIGKARFLLMSSQWFETFGRTVAEAFSRGTPVLASRLGALQELVQDGVNGFTFEPGSVQDLAQTITRFRSLSSTEEDSLRMAARQTFESRFSQKASYVQLLHVYEHALASMQPQHRSEAALSETRNLLAT